uniref:Cytochrome c oxidase subunit 2 n=1 Tax=Aegilips sp. ZJUH 20220002 TaxID=2943451 RepID=A0A9E8G765_9HYME|nr:cytochrome c oxidase subunit 2 [Aegilips sp. ZJUH 20220002]
MNSWFYLNLQDASSPLMEWLIKFHDFSLLINLLITIYIALLIYSILNNKLINYNLNNQMIEIIWTIIPITILMSMAIPSLKILYLTDEMFTPLLYIKCMGHQWYWTYELPDFNNIEIESYMNKTLMLNSFRLLDTDNYLTLPMNSQIQLLVSSDDVIHSFTIPSMGIKTDGIPGRINSTNLFNNRPGTFFGQCSEICGANHSFMPIMVNMTYMKNFIKWLNNIN